MAARGKRSLLMIDLGMPRNVARSRRIYNMYLYRVDDLSEIVRTKQESARSGNPASRNDRRRADRAIHAWQAGVEAGRRGRSAGEAGSRTGDFFARTMAPGASLGEGARGSRRMIDELLDRVVMDPAEKLKDVRNCAGSSRTSKHCGIFFGWTGKAVTTANWNQGKRAGTLAGGSIGAAQGVTAASIRTAT